MKDPLELLADLEALAYESGHRYLSVQERKVMEETREKLKALLSFCIGRNRALGKKAVAYLELLDAYGDLCWLAGGGSLSEKEDEELKAAYEKLRTKLSSPTHKCNEIDGREYYKDYP